MTLQELNQMSYDKIVFLWNEYCEEVSSFTDMLYTNDDEAFSTFGFSINGTLINNTNELYDWNDEYVTADVKGNPWSANDPKVIMDLSALLEWVNKGDNEKAFSQNNESDLRENDWFHGGSIRLFDFVLRGIKLNKDAILHSAHMINKNAVSS